MKKLIIAATAAAMLFTGAAVSAQPAQGGPANMRPTSQADAIARADQRFQRLDSNRDGRLTRTELQAGKQRAGAKAGQQRSGGPDVHKRGKKGGPQIERLDTNRDGVITRAEFRSHALERFANRDSKRGGQHGRSSQPQARR